MKHLHILVATILCSITLAFLGCKKDDPEPEPEPEPEPMPTITYPETGATGMNVLTLSDSDTVNVNVSRSVVAVSENGAELTVVFHNHSEVQPDGYIPDWWVEHHTRNWFVSDYDESTHIQTFTMTPDSVADVYFSFSAWYGLTGVATIEIIEGKTGNPVQNKTVFWKKL